ncbi:ABC transporter permease [Oxalobacteraceae bacterium A2-2]
MLRNYLLTAYKVFLRRKLFTAINLLCIVLTLVVLMVVTALLQNAFYPTGVEHRSERFVQIVMAQYKGPHAERRGPLGYKFIDRDLRHLPSAVAVAAVSWPQTLSAYQPGRVTTVQIRYADADYWKIMDFKLLGGRLPTADDVASARYVTVINDSMARQLFPGQSALQQKLNVGGVNYTIIGVVEDTLQLNSYADLWAPITTMPGADYRQAESGTLTALLMARSAGELPALKREIEQAAGKVQFNDPRRWSKASFWGDSKLDVVARTLMNSEGSDAGGAKLLSMIAAAMLLFMLLPALNLVNLNTGRILERSAEIGVRKAFGATSAQMAGQLLLENVLLCLAGGALGLAATAGVLWWLEGSGLIPYLKVQMNWTVFALGLLITLVFGLLSGVLPAWKMSRLDPVHALKGTA